tara:strand:- start:630 stop:1667 length:1038 start_codon:yes stop_codon:yes gene_type:complete
MKVALGFNLRNDAWGGGNQFANSLAKFLKLAGHDIVFSLDDRDIDIILLTDPRSNAPAVSFGAGAIFRYLLTKNRNALVVHRINECDERKNTKNMNYMLRTANQVADHTVFIASWLKELDVWSRNSPFSIILNGGDKKIFNDRYYNEWVPGTPLKVVTHHWGGNIMKGFDVYSYLDTKIRNPIRDILVEFTYIGNIPRKFKFQNISHIEPLIGDKLARSLSSHHVYITASLNEPAGMHHIEGAMSGLPLIYRKSGALPEYCDGFGICFERVDEIPDVIASMVGQYKNFRAKLRDYPHTSEKMCTEYLALFESMYERRDEVLEKRNLFKKKWSILKNQMPSWFFQI